MADFDTDKKIQDFLAKQKQWLDDDIITQTEYNAAVRDATAGAIGYTAALKNSTQALQKSLFDLAGSIAQGTQGTSQFNGALRAGGDVLKSKIKPKWGKWGDALKLSTDILVGFGSKLTKQTDQLFASFQDLTRTGSVLGIEDTFDNLQSMGYTMGEIGQMQSLLKENSVTLAQFGGTATEGTKKFAAMSKAIVYGDLGKEFMRMGMTVNDINGGIANYIQLQRVTGQIGKKTAEQMQVEAGAYIQKQDQLTKLTGITADAQQKIVDAAMEEEAYASIQFQLRARGDEATAKFNDDMLKLMATRPDLAKGFKAFASNRMNEDSQRFVNSAGNEFVSNYFNGSRDTIKMYGQMNEGLSKAAETYAKAAQGAYLDGFAINFPELVRSANLPYGKALEEYDNLVKKDQANQKAGTDPIVKNLVDISIDQRNLAQTADRLVKNTMPLVTFGMDKLGGATSKLNDIVNGIIGKQGKIGGSPATTPSTSPTTTPSTTAPTATPTTPASNQTSKIIGAESGGRNIANASGPGGTPNSSAFGVGQMLKGTFEDLARKATPGTSLYGKTFEDMKNDVNLQVAATEEYKKQNASALIKNGFEASDINIYLAHFLGTTGALRTLRANDSAALSSVISQAALEKNPQLQNLATVSDLKAWAATKLATPVQSAASGGILSGPKSGYQAMLHGTEAVVPLPDGRTIPVQIQGNKNQQEQVSLLSMELDKLDTILRVMQSQNDVSQRILQRQV